MTSIRLDKRSTRIFVVAFILVAILSAVFGAVVFKRMIEDEELQERLDEVRSGKAD